MQPLLFTARLATGDAEVDAQHRALFAAANALLAPADDRDGVDLFLRGMAFLERYCRWHFATEERAMERRDYPLLQQHRRGHQALALRIQDLRRRSETVGPSEDVRLRLHRLVSDWVAVHVEVMDRDFVRFAQGGAVLSPEAPADDGEADLAEAARVAATDVPEASLGESIRARW